MPNVFIQAPTENEVLTMVEHIGDEEIKKAVLALLWWMMLPVEQEKEE